jgi:hypothetical protein
MVVLSGHGPEPSDLPEKPLHYGFATADIVRQESANFLR